MNKIVAGVLWAMIFLLGCANSGPDMNGLIEVRLKPKAPSDQGGLRWSPKGEKLILTQTQSGWTAELHLGPDQLNPINLYLSAKEAGDPFDHLAIDMDRDGQFDGSADTLLICTPKEQRGKIWSSFSVDLSIPFEKTKSHPAVKNPYPVSFWFVEDPQAEETERVIRYSRRGWMEGEAEIPSGKIHILLTEMVMDGVYDRQDSWAICPDSSISDLMLGKSAKEAGSHNWLGEQAYGIDSLLPSGRILWIKEVDPKITRAEEEAAADFLATDRAAKRTGKKVAFLTDFAYAHDLAVQRNQNLFVDFETSWCGPCKTMDQWVYTADTVAQLSKQLVCVKVDGDEQRDLVKKYDVTGYPTLLLISPKGDVLNKLTGYQSVEKVRAFLTTAF